MKLAIIFLLLTAAVAMLPGPIDPSLAADEVVAIVGATLIDGSGHQPLRDSAVVLKGESIIAAGRRDQVKIPANARVIDGRGMVVSPGFIDAHNHSDRGFESDPSAASQVSQGITTVVIGQDGGSAFPIGEALNKLDQNPIALNVLTFVGHATVRSRVMRDDTNRLATPAEIAQMKQMVEQAMRDGAIGLSTGLEYETGKLASTEEVIAMTEVDKWYGALHVLKKVSLSVRRGEKVVICGPSGSG